MKESAEYLQANKLRVLFQNHASSLEMSTKELLPELTEILQQLARENNLPEPTDTDIGSIEIYVSLYH